MKIAQAFTPALLAAWLALTPMPAALAQGQDTPTAPQREGVDVGRSSVLAKLVPAEEIEASAAKQYSDMLRQAASQNALGGPDHPQVKRLRHIAQRLIPYVNQWNPRAKTWKWEVNLIGSKQLNAFCMPGGKIAFYTGILEQLQLTDDEVAQIMGHEIAHALREHARARMGKSAATMLPLLRQSSDELDAMGQKKVVDAGWTHGISEAAGEDWFKRRYRDLPGFGRDIDALLFKVKIAHSRRIYGIVDAGLLRKITIADLDAGFASFKESMKKSATYGGNKQFVSSMFL